MKAILTLKFADAEPLNLELEEVIVLKLNTDAVTQLAFNRSKDGKWRMVVNDRLLVDKLATEFLTARKVEA